MVPSVLRHMSIGYKLLLSILVPLLAMAWFASLQVLDRQRAVSDMDQLLGLTELAVTAGNLVHELQRERGNSALYLGSDGQRFGAELEQQRRDTDLGLEPFRTQSERLQGSAGSDIGKSIAGIWQDLESLQTKRDQVSDLRASLDQSAQYYTSLNTQLIDAIGHLIHATDEAETARMLAAYFALLRTKELAGIERAVLAGAFGRDSIDAETYLQFVSLIGAQQAQQGFFHTLASEAQRSLLQAELSDPGLARLDAFRLAVLESASRSDFGVDPAVWFALQTDKIDRLQVVEESMTNGVRESVGLLRDEAQGELVRNAVVALLVAGLVVLVAALVGRNIVLRLKETAQAMREIAEGDGDLTRRLDESHGDEIGMLARQFNAFASRMQELLLLVRESAERVHAASEEIARGSEALSSRTEQDAASLQETSASMEEITATVNQSADAARQASDMTLSTVDVARQGEAAMQDVGVTMADINDSSAKISEIIGLIDSIAFQTNILALNASVEAARAGEHGKGFAVVAQEVRNLAGRSSDASREIRQLIDSSGSLTRKGAELVGRAAATMENIVANVGKVNEVIAAISDGAREQNAGILQVNQAVAEMDSATQRNVAMVEQTSTAASEMRYESDRLKQLMASFVLGERSRSEAGERKHSPAQRQEFAMLAGGD
jgi:methyl-accepting chemotaxis protein